MNGRIRPEEKLKFAGIWRGNDGQAGSIKFGRDAQGRIRGVCDHTVVQRFAPEFLEVAAGIGGLQTVTHRIVATQARFIAERRQNFMRRASVIKRRDQRLNHRDGAIEAARVAPGFQIVRFRHVPSAMLGSLVEVRAQVYGVRNLAQLGREIEIVRRVVNGITAEDQQGVDLARIDISAKLAQRLQIVDRIGLYRLGVVNRVANVAQRAVDGVHQRVHLGGLLFAGDYQGSPLIFLEILYDDFKPLFRFRRKGSTSAQAKLASQSAGKLFDLQEAEGEAVVCAGTGHRWRRLNHIKAIHFSAGAIDLRKL